MRKLLVGFLVVIVLLGGAILIAPSLIDWNAYKGQISAQVEAATGRRLAIDGELRLEILPTPSLAAGGVRLSNVEGAASEDMVRLRAALIQVALGPLFRGRIEVDTVVLVEPRIELERLSDGRTNWTLEPDGATPGPTPATAPGEEEVAGLRLPPIRFDDIRIRDGTVVFRDATTGGVERIENINAKLVAGSLEGPFRGEGELEARGIPLEFKASIRRLAEDRAIPVNVELRAGGGEAAFSGVVSGFPAEPRINGRLTGNAPDPAAVLAAVAGETAPPAFSRVAAALDGNVAATRESIAINDLSIRLGEGSATGAVSIALGEIPQADIVLNVGQIDLDALLERNGEELRGAPERDRGESNGGEGARSVVPGQRQAEEFALPTGFAATLETKVDAILLNGGVIRQTQLAMELRDGGLTISQAAAQLPGGSDIAVFGFVGSQQGAPAFDGQVEASSDNFRALLEWLNVDTAGVPADRLRRFEMAAEISATPAELTVSGVDIQIDVSRVRGGVAVALRQRPGFGIGFSIDRLNLDAYLARDAAEGDGAEPGGEEPAGEVAARDDGAAIVAPLSFEGLEILDRFDAILQLQIGSLTYRDTTATGLSFDGTLQGGALELRNAGVTDFQGAALSVSGNLAGLAADPSVALDVNMNAADAAGLLEFLGVEPAVPVRRAVLSASLEGNLSQVRLDARLETLGGSIRADGSLASLDETPTYDLDVEVRHPSLGRLLQSFIETPAEAAPDGFSVTAMLSGDLARAELDVVARVGQGSVSARGEIGELTTEPTAKFLLDAQHPDLTSLLRAFVPSYRPALEDIGEFRLTTQIAYTPQLVNVTALQGAVGPVALQGEAELDLAGERPRIIAALSTSEIITDWFLAKPGAAGTGERTASTPGAAEAQDTRDTRRWSRDPMNFTALSAFDADISLTTPALGYEGYRVEQPEIAINLEAGRLQVKQLAGRVFGGSFSMTAELTDGNVPTASMVLSIA
ncbi:MAG: AsmA family protein, partial [Alphaproteobacteria bacterium]